MIKKDFLEIDINNANSNKIDGLLYANKIQLMIKDLIDKLNDQFFIRPHIAIILVGNNTASEIYVKNKIKIANKLGIIADIIRYDNCIAENELLNKIYYINKDKNIDGVIVQLPLPEHLNKDKVLSIIDPTKDIDGLNIFNIGLLNSLKEIPYSIEEILDNNKFNFDNKNFLFEKITNIGKTIPFIPCTPLGCFYLINKTLKDINENIVSKNAVIFGNSNLVSKPMSRILLQSGATVTTLHSKSLNKDCYIENADIIISATGKKIDLFKIKNNAILIDIGIRKKENGNGITGDLDFNNIVKTNKITPVPHGVGPMTVTSLMFNSLLSVIKKIR